MRQFSNLNNNQKVMIQETKPKPNLNDLQILTLWVGATHYYLGRSSYAVSDFSELLIQQWDSLPEKTQFIIRRRIEEFFERDDRARSEGSDCKPLGHNCDRASWDNVRALWKK
jgi:hypothetical protein